MVKQDMNTRFAELKSMQIVESNKEKSDLNEELFIGETFNTDDIFRDFENALAEYEQQDDEISEKVMNDANSDPVGNLVAETNKFLVDLSSKYNEVFSRMNALEDLTSEQAGKVGAELEDKINSKLVKLEAKYDFLLKNLQTIMKNADDDIRNDINMRMEDFNVLRKTTTSRLSVYEARIDMLEELVLSYTKKPTEPPLDLFTELTTEESTTLRTTESSMPEYDDLGGNDFSMLGIDDPKDLDNLKSFNLKSKALDCLQPPCDTLPVLTKDGSPLGTMHLPIRKDVGRSKRQHQPFLSSSTFPPPKHTPAQTEEIHERDRNKQNPTTMCDCEKLRV